MAGLHLICFLLGAGVSPAPVYGLFEDVSGPPDCSLVSGNGGLTVGVNAYGRVTTCRWPSPSYYNQVTYQTVSRDLPLKGVAPGDGLMWGLQYAGKTHWLNGSEGTVDRQFMPNGTSVLVTETTLPGLPGAATQETFVHWERDVLVSRLEFPADAGAVQAFWYANPSPCTRYVPEAPVADWLLRSLNDFAAFSSEDDSAIYHFRPGEPSFYDWQDAELWATGPQADVPELLKRDGMWMGYTSSAPFTALTCASETGDGSALEQAENGHLSDRWANVGQSASAVMVPQGGETPRASATMYMAFGSNRKVVDTLLEWARNTGYEALLEETNAHWLEQLKAFEISDAAPPELQAQLTSSLFTLAVATDGDTGAVVRAPLSQPPLALDVPRHSIWADIALDLVGAHEAAGKHLDFLLSHVRTQDRPGMPAGSLPAALYADGVDGAPHVILDGESPGWLLWALWQHDGYLDSDEQTTFFEKRWNAIDTLAVFLMNRSDARAGAPLVSFDPDKLRESATVRFLAAAYAGLRSADAIARVVGHERPEWRGRLKELEDTFHAEAFNSEGQWKLERPLILWPAGFLDAGDPRWNPVTEKVLDELGERPPAKALEDACNLSMLWRDQPDRLARLAPLLETTVARARALRPVDTLDAARAVITIATVFGRRTVP